MDLWLNSKLSSSKDSSTQCHHTQRQTVWLLEPSFGSFLRIVKWKVFTTVSHFFFSWAATESAELDLNPATNWQTTTNNSKQWRTTMNNNDRRRQTMTNNKPWKMTNRNKQQQWQTVTNSDKPSLLIQTLQHIATNCAFFYKPCDKPCLLLQTQTEEREKD